MNTKLLAGLAAAGATASALVVYLLRNRRPAARYLLGATAFLLPFGAYATTTTLKGKTTFLFITDTHGSANINTLLVKALLREPDVDFVVHGGDIADGEQWWTTWWDTPFKGLIDRYPVYPVTGNHDMDALTGFNRRFPGRSSPYKVSFPGVDLFFIPWGAGSSAAAWLDQATLASTAPCKILVTHRPLWPAQGSGSNLPTLLAGSLPRLDLVLAGHNHVSQDRTVNGLRQIIAISGPKKYTCNADATGCVNGQTDYWRIEVGRDGVYHAIRKVVQ